VALWPKPRVAWPPGIRIYPTGTDVEVEGQEGLVGGTKRFRYLVIADSAGAHLVPGLSYPYFDTALRDYAVAAAPGVRLVAPPGLATVPPRPLPAPLLPRDTASLAERIAGMARWLWLVLLALPPLAFAALQALARLPRPRPHASPSERDAQALEALGRELRQALERRAGNAAQLEGAPLAAALRAAGVEASLAQHVARVRDRLRQAVFGPHDAADREELSAEVREVLRALAGETPGAERRQLVETTLGLFLLLAAAVPTAAQAPRPEQLYEAGAFRTAADSFSARVEREPAVAAYWYNLGAAFYRLGEDGRARAAWMRAARLTPRREAVRRAMALLPGDPLADDIAPVAPVTPAEAATLGLLLWVVGWGLAMSRRTRRVGVVVVGLALVAAAAAWRADRRYHEPVAVALRADVPLRGAPFASAPSSRQLPLGGVVRVRAASGAWLLVSRGDAAGWVQVGEVARL
jgi:tetratricopeptide (TPR) repeat protein